MEKINIDNNENSENSEKIKTNEKKIDIANKLKENIRTFFSQLKLGCSRKFCYNPYCKKSNHTELIADSMKYAKLKDCEQYFCKSVTSSELFALSFDMEPELYERKFNSDYLIPLNIDFIKLKNFYDTNRDRDICTDIEEINHNLNSIFSSFYEKINLNDVYYSRLLYYFFNIYSKLLIIISMNPSFCYIESVQRDFLTFFDNFKKLYKKIKELEKINKGINSNLNFSHLISFNEFKYNKEIFSNIINNYQNFLALLLFQVGEGEEDDYRDEKTFEVLIKFMSIFNFIHQINEKLSIVNFREFYNDSVSKYLNVKIECKNYLNSLKVKKGGEKPFSLIKYHWLFDAASKSDILYTFNYHKQRTEMVNSFSDIINLHLNSIDLRSMYLFMEVRRHNLIEDTLNFVSNPTLNFRKQLKVKFVGEQGIDEGGVKKEFFLLVIRQLFDPDYGMFTYSEKTRFFWFNSLSFEPKIKFELIGILLGLAFFNNVILDIKFPSVIYKKILGLPSYIDDLREIDPELYNNLQYLLTTKETNLKDALCSTFTVIVDQFGEKISVPLKENGENIFIDEFNREEYVSLYLEWYFNKSIENVFIPFRNGFYRVCDDKLFHILRPEELELIICGTQNLDFIELEKSARYDDGYEKDSETIKNFWEVIHSLSTDEKKKFLFFVTGCDRAPINGLGSLIITISRFGPDSDKLPCAHTCFNHLLLPDYENKEKLRERLVIAIKNSEGFGLM